MKESIIDFHCELRSEIEQKLRVFPKRCTNQVEIVEGESDEERCIPVGQHRTRIHRESHFRNVDFKEIFTSFELDSVIQ